MATGAGADVSLTEWVVLALLGESPAHGFAVARELAPGADLGRIVTVHRPLVYRALDRLVVLGLIEPHQTEPGTAGPNRRVHRPTRRGRRALDTWFARPVGHVRDLRIEFLVKIRLGERAGRDPSTLVEAQRAALAEVFDGLALHHADGDVVDLWRRHTATAARDFLDALAASAGGRPGDAAGADVRAQSQAASS